VHESLKEMEERIREILENIEMERGKEREKEKKEYIKCREKKR